MLARAMDKVLVAGAGITGAVTASLLRKRLPEATTITIWDKSRGTGGRMNTSRGPAGSTVDLGAQYVSAEPADFAKHSKFYEELLSKHLLLPMQGAIENEKIRVEGTRHFVAPDGIGTLAKHYIKDSGADVKFNHLIKEIQEDNGQWAVKTEDGTSQMFDCVVLTMPVPQILQLQGTVQSDLVSQSELRQKLEKVQYSSRFALGVFYPPGTQINIPWCAKYYPKDPVIAFISVDNRKRGKESSEIGPSFMVHANVPFSLKHIEEDKDAVCKQYLLTRLNELIPDMPEPTEIKSHKWRFSQTFKAFEGRPGAVALHDKPLLVLGGDAFVHSNYNGCVDSALAISDAVVQHAKTAQL